VVVVGGRVAGATVAAVLGDAGAHVLLVERVAFPSPTISTHFFRGAGCVAVLARLGVLERVLTLGAPRLVREFEFGFAGDGSVAEVGPQEPGELGFGLSVRREPLDDLLLGRARSVPLVEVAQPASVVGLLREDGRVVGVRVRERSGERDVWARLVVGADGRRSLVAREAATPAIREEPPSRTLYYQYFSGWRGLDGGAPDAAEFSLRGDELAYVFPCDAGLTCVAVSASASEFAAFRAAPNRELTRRLRAHPQLAARVKRSEAVGRTAGGPPEASWLRATHGPGWALVGDAALHQDPWTGRGMDMASVHATFLADEVVDWLNGQTTENEALRRYRARRDEHALAVFEETVTFARDLSLLQDEGAAPAVNQD
jgi:flavin-dependent dehydrogenase